MAIPSDNENWLIEEGDRIIQKKHLRGAESLTAWEELAYCLWVADYGMRNAGDLDVAKDIDADFQSKALRSAEQLALPLTRAAFALKQRAFEKAYFDRFEAICTEIRNAQRGQPDESSDS
jgi:hypothetical protein